MANLLILAVFALVLCSWSTVTLTVFAQSTNPPSVHPPTTTLTPEQECALLNSSCEVCVSNAKCLFCYSGGGSCKPYPVGHVLPRSSDCDLGEARWGVCWMNFKVLIITLSVIAGVLLISFCCCIYCCCCRSKGKKNKYLKEEAKYEREREERRQRAEERKADRKERADEIRKKYGIGFKGSGLIKDDNPYQRFDA